MQCAATAPRGAGDDRSAVALAAGGAAMLSARSEALDRELRRCAEGPELSKPSWTRLEEKSLGVFGEIVSLKILAWTRVR